MYMQPRGSCKTSTAIKQAKPLRVVEITTLSRIDKEQDMDLPLYGTDQHWDSLYWLVKPLYSSRTSGLSRLTSKHLHSSKLLRTVGIYPLPTPYPEGYTIPLLLSSGFTHNTEQHLHSKARKKMQITFLACPGSQSNAATRGNVPTVRSITFHITVLLPFLWCYLEL